jgi:DNA-binding NarL/FixJ family response regulator
MNDPRGFEAVHFGHLDVHQAYIRVIALSLFEEEEQVAAMIDAWASTYLSKNGKTDLLLAAIREEIE